jgi:hypothetical protein
MIHFGGRSVPRSYIAAAAAAAAVPLVGSAVPGDAGTRTFVLSTVYVASYPEDDACPKLSLTARDILLEGLPAEQREKLADPAKERELSAVMNSKFGFRGGPTGARPGRNGSAPSYTADEIEALRTKFRIPAGKGKPTYLGLVFSYNLCTDPDDFPAFAVGNVPYAGKVSYGMNLDGKESPDDFSGPDGTKGVDNALIAATGCNRTTRDYGDPKVADEVITSLSAPPIMQIAGIDDPLNDDEVEVRFFVADSPLELDGRGKPLAWATFEIDPDPRFRSATRGRIQNGVLTTEPFDLRIRVREQIIDSYREIKGARVRMPLAGDDAIGGNIFGYHTLESMFEPYAQSGTTGYNLMSCPAAVKEIRKHADGYPDPRTRKNTAISSALNFRGVPAFAVPSGGSVTAGR